MPFSCWDNMYSSFVLLENYTPILPYDGIYAHITSPQAIYIKISYFFKTLLFYPKKKAFQLLFTS